MPVKNRLLRQFKFQVVITDLVIWLLIDVISSSHFVLHIYAAMISSMC